MTSSTSTRPIVFEDFFEMGLEGGASPFLTPQSRRWGFQLTLKASLVAALLLFLAFALSFYSPLLPLSQFLLITVYFLAGVPALIEAVQDLCDGEINIDILMTLAAFSSFAIGGGMEGALLLVLFAISGATEDAVTDRAKGSISGLRKLSPATASLVQEDGTLIERSVKDITKDSLILVKANQVVPLDGVVISGGSSVNLVHLTGENLPVRKEVGDLVPAGARNLEGALTLQVTHTSADSTVAKIIQLVTQAQESRPKLQRWFDKLSRGYAIAIITLSAFFTLILPWLIGIPFLGKEGSLYRSLTFLIAASPCALILAIPIAYLSAVSACARRGALLKGGIALDALAACQIMAFDKTGTLTTGELACLRFESLQQTSPEEQKRALAAAYAMEQNALHPIAKGIISYAESQGVRPAELEKFKSIPGYGLEATFQDREGSHTAFIGHLDYIRSRLPSLLQEKIEAKAKEARERGELLALLLVDQALYLFCLADTLRPGIEQALKPLHDREKMRLLMLTGDHRESAIRIASAIGIDEVYANLRPEDKLRYVSSLSKEKGLAMVGDGINDAPALARATVGICMGKGGSNTAVDAADIILLHDAIDVLEWLVRKSRQTLRIVKQNLGVAFGAMIIASSLALSGLIPLWLAVILHEGGTLLVALNALRLLRD